jgi:hypothetical protein
VRGSTARGGEILDPQGRQPRIAASSGTGGTMFDQQPGKGTRTHHAGHAHDAAGPGPGKHSRVEQELGGQGHGEPIVQLLVAVRPGAT